MEIEREFGRATPERRPTLEDVIRRLDRIEAMLRVFLDGMGEGDDEREVRAHRGRHRLRVEDHGGDY